MQATLHIRDLALASWEVPFETIADTLPAELRPVEVEGRFLVTIVGFRIRGGRVGHLPVLPFSQLNVRTYVSWKGEPAVFFLAARVSAGGLPARLLGAPYRQARVRVRPDGVQAGGLGVRLRFAVSEPAEPGALGRHELGLFEHGGLRAFRITRSEAEWRRAELVEPARTDFLLGLGIEVQGEPELLYTPATSFATDVPVRARAYD